VNLGKAPGVPSGIKPRVSAPAPASRAGTGTRKYLVREGESLADISREVYGNPNKWPVIYNANLGKIRNPANLTPGISLVIPK
jgi:nucleoid-associated protein YgaU